MRLDRELSVTPGLPRALLRSLPPLPPSIPPRCMVTPSRSVSQEFCVKGVMQSVLFFASFWVFLHLRAPFRTFQPRLQVQSSFHLQRDTFPKSCGHCGFRLCDSGSSGASDASVALFDESVCLWLCERTEWSRGHSPCAVHESSVASQHCQLPLIFPVMGTCPSFSLCLVMFRRCRHREPDLLGARCFAFG